MRWPKWLSFVAGALFLRGFLLWRNELPHRSACSDAQHLAQGGNSTVGGCWSPALYDRAVFLVIDALRFDFVAPLDETSGACGGMHAYHCNRMPKVARALAGRPLQARLYRASADAPTVTMQRVKALATGTLPTFVDIGSSFGSGRVEEDSWLTQAAAVAGGEGALRLIGDDTWASLFPGVLGPAVQGPSPSAFSTFDTKDLDSGDEAVAQHLLPALRALDGGGRQQGAPWRALIAHAPGVDHVGHTHRPDHPLMASKLGAMDDLVDSVVSALDRAPGATLLVVLGDHGMSEDGNHGGATAEEEGTALLAMAFGRPLLRAAAGPPGGSAVPPPTTVSQLDIVPSLSLALGLPIPFNSLGRVFTDWDWGEGGGLRTTAFATLLAAWAQLRFLKAYSVSAGERHAALSPTVALAALEGRFAELLLRHKALEGSSAGAVSEGDWEQQISALGTLCNTIASACRAQWAQFSQPFILLGLLGLGLALGGALWSAGRGEQSESQPRFLATKDKGTQAAAPPSIQQRHLLALALPGIATLTCVGRVWALFTDTFITAEAPLLLALQALLVVPIGASLVQALLPGSPLGSRKVAAFIPLLLALVYCLLALASAGAPWGWVHSSFLSTHRGLVQASLALGAGAAPPVLLPVDALEATTREYWGASLSALLGLASLPLLLSPPALYAVVASFGVYGGGGHSLREVSTSYDHATPLHARYLGVHALTLASLLCVWLHWQGWGGGASHGDGGGRGGGLTPRSALDALLPPLRLALPRAVFLCTALALSFLCLRARLAPSRKATPRLFSALGRTFVASSALLPLSSLLLGPWSPPILALLYCQGLALVLLVLAGTGGRPPLCHLAALPHRAGLASSSPLSFLLLPGHHAIPLHATAMAVGLFTSHAWAATGHTAQFSALSYNAGFLGFDTFNFARSGLLLAANTYGVSHGCLGGALLLWPMCHALAYNGGVEDMGALARARALPGLVAVYALASVIGIATMCAISQRHMMVWAVFAPKLVFEVAGALALALGVAATEALLRASSQRF
jgi:hypothetical protein